MAHAWNRSFINSGSNPPNMFNPPPPGVDFGAPPPQGNPLFPPPALSSDPFPAGFFSDPVDSSSKNGQSTSGSGDKDFVSVAEQLFPPGKKADLQEKFWSDPTQMYIGKYINQLENCEGQKKYGHGIGLCWFSKTLDFHI